MCIAILNKLKCHFFLLQNQRIGEQSRFSLGTWYQWEGGGYRERVYICTIFTLYNQENKHAQNTPEKTLIFYLRLILGMKTAYNNQNKTDNNR
jgi:hypothetical protein